MKLGEIKTLDIANGAGIRVSVFVSGCTHRCEGCFNAEAWDFNFGKEYTKEIEDYIVEELKKDYHDGISFLGGEPLELPNQSGVLQLIRRVAQECPNKDIWLWTGYTLESDLLNQNSRIYSKELQEILSYVDILIDGEWKASLYDAALQFRGSSNQRVIALKETLKTGKVVIWDDLIR